MLPSCFFPFLYLKYPISWQELLQITQERKALLAGAAEVHSFIREADDTKDMITDKVRWKGIGAWVWSVCMYIRTYTLLLSDGHA